MPTVNSPWELVLDKTPLEAVHRSIGADPIYDPEATLALVYTSEDHGPSERSRVLTHTNVMANVHFLNYWMPLIMRGGVYLHAAPMFHIADFPLHVCCTGVWHLPGDDSKIHPPGLL